MITNSIIENENLLDWQTIYRTNNNNRNFDISGFNKIINHNYTMPGGMFVDLIIEPGTNILRYNNNISIYELPVADSNSDSDTVPLNNKFYTKYEHLIRSFSGDVYNNELEESFAASSQGVENALVIAKLILNTHKWPYVDFFGDRSIGFIWRSDTFVGGFRLIGNNEVSCSYRIKPNDFFYGHCTIDNLDYINKMLALFTYLV